MPGFHLVHVAISASLRVELGLLRRRMDELINCGSGFLAGLRSETELESSDPFPPTRGMVSDLVTRTGLSVGWEGEPVPILEGGLAAPHDWT